MPSRLHRLNVRRTLLDALRATYLGVNVVSREEGVVDVVIRNQPGMRTRDDLETVVQNVCASHGIEFDLISSNASDTAVGLRFDNHIMREQRLWGARGMSRAARIARGIEAPTTERQAPSTPAPAEVVASSMAGEIEPDEEPVLVAAGEVEPDEPSEQVAGRTDALPARRRRSR